MRKEILNPKNHFGAYADGCPDSGRDCTHKMRVLQESYRLFEGEKGSLIVCSSHEKQKKNFSVKNLAGR